MSVAIATASNVVGLDEDEPLLLAALRTRGVEVAVVAWDDDGVDWSQFELVVVRSTWNYHLRRDDFVAWASSLPAVLNPADVLRWNTDKRYLRDLEAAGVPVVPTAWLEPGDACVLPEWPDRPELVVKPAVSAGSLRTGRYGANDLDAAATHARELLAEERTVMVQPYLAEIDEAGETALVYLDGRYSHAIRKGPILRPGGGMFEGPYAHEDITPRRSTPAERELAAAALAAVPGGADRLLYARVDVVADESGSPVVLELELTEPSLFLTEAKGSADALASAIAARTR